MEDAMRTTLIAVLVLAFLIPGHAATPNGPFWIVAGSFANPDYTTTQYEAVRKTSAEVKRCGLEPFSDFSGKFTGFADGFDVVVVGGYATKAAAEADLERLRPASRRPMCVRGVTRASSSR